MTNHSGNRRDRARSILACKATERMVADGAPFHRASPVSASRKCARRHGDRRVTVTVPGRGRVDAPREAAPVSSNYQRMGTSFVGREEAGRTA